MIKELLDQLKESDSIDALKTHSDTEYQYDFKRVMLSTDSRFKMESEKMDQVQEKLWALVFEKHSSALHQNLFQHKDRAALPIILES